MSARTTPGRQGWQNGGGGWRAAPSFPSAPLSAASETSVSVWPRGAATLFTASPRCRKKTPAIGRRAAASTLIRSDNAARVTACSPLSFHAPVMKGFSQGIISAVFLCTLRSRGRPQPVAVLPSSRITIELSAHRPKPLSASASEVVVLPVPLCAKTSTCASLPGRVSPAACSMNCPEASIAASTASMPAVAPTRETLSAATMISAVCRDGSIASEIRFGNARCSREPSARRRSPPPRRSALHRRPTHRPGSAAVRLRAHAT